MTRLWRPVLTLTLVVTTTAGCSTSQPDDDQDPGPVDTVNVTPRDQVPHTVIATMETTDPQTEVNVATSTEEVTGLWGSAPEELTDDQVALVVNPTAQVTNATITRVSTDGTRYIVHVTGTQRSCDTGRPEQALVYVTVDPGIDKDADHTLSVEPLPGCVTTR